MSFAIPIFLGAAAFIAVPIIIHMIERQRFQQIELPTVQFVTRTEKRNIIRLRLIDILLLLLRVLIVALIVLAFANPLLPSGTFGMPLPTDAQIIVDDSTSMARLAPDGQKLIDKAKEAAISILESLPEGGNVSVVAMSGMLTPSFSLDRSKARASLDAIELTPSPSRAVEMALQGVSLIGSGGSGTGEDKARRKEIYFITDLCRNSFGQDLQDLANVVKSSTDDGLFGAPNIYIIDVGEASTANVANRGVRGTRSRISL
ncbi:MAG: BatA domain-containing protein, partial [Planctomycetia bacterium]|nr:BatA domain-containing protein [Planctomycetia bacterium]